MALSDVATARLVRRPEALWRRGLDVTYVLLDTEPVELGGAATVLWDLLADGPTEHDLIDVVADAHGERPATVAAAVRAALTTLVDRGLIETAPPAWSPGEPEVQPVAAQRAHAGDRTPDDPAAAIAGWGLVGCELAVPPPAGTWDGMFHTIRRERLSGLAVSAVAAGALDLTTDQRDGLRAAHAVAMVHALRLERFLLDSIELFEGAGIEALVLKGPAMAHRHHADPRERPFGDIDVLVPSDQLDAAFDLLAASGHQRRYPEPRPGFDRRFGKGAAFVSPEGLELDVHRTFAAGPFGIRVRLEDAHAAPASFTVGGRVVRTLADGPMLVSVAMHAVLGTHRSRLLNLRDVAQLLGGADEATVAALATRWGADAVLAEAVRRASGAFGLDPALPLVGWASAHQGDRRQLRAMSAYTTADRSYGGQALAALPAISRWTDRASYLRALVLPHRSYLADRDRSQLARWRRMTTSAVRQARRAGR